MGHVNLDHLGEATEDETGTHVKKNKKKHHLLSPYVLTLQQHLIGFHCHDSSDSGNPYGDKSNLQPVIAPHLY